MAKTTDEIEVKITGDASDLTAATRQASRSLGTVDTAARKTTNNLEGIKFAAQGAGGRLGEMAGRAENFGRSFAALGSVGGPVLVATASIAAVGIASVAMGAAVVKGTAVATQAIVGLTRSAQDAIEEFDYLKGTTLFFTDDQIARIDRANVGLDGAGFLASKLGVELASNVAPSVERVSILVGAMALGAIDAFNAVLGGADALGDGLDLVGRAVYTSMIAPFQTAAEHIRDMRSALGLSTDTLDGMIDGWETWNQVTRTGITQLDAYTGTSMQGYIDQSTQAIRLVGELAEAEEQRAEGVQVNTDALEKQAKAMRLLEIAKASAKRDNGTDKEAALAAEALAAAKAEASEATVQQASNEATYRDALQATAGVVSSIPGLFKKGSREAAIASKVSATAQAAINTALSITSALTIPPPVGQAIAVANGLAGAAQIAAIQSTPIPAFALGGVVSTDAPRAYNDGRDERHVTARPGEVILPPDALKALGGAGGTTIVVDAREQNRPLTRSRIRQRSQTRIPQSRDRQVTA